MDPWLEDPDTFPDIHDALITCLREALNAALPRGYVARSRNRVWVDDQSRSEPDVSLTGRKRRPAAGGTRLAPSGMLALGQERSDPTEEPYLEILATTGKRLVTAVEVLSPSNKRPGSAGRKDYLKKQKEFRLAGVNAVEVDLLRRGRHTTAAPLATLRRKAGAFDYHVSVRVAGDPAELYAAAWRLADRLPAVGVPLDPGMEFVTVELQPLFDRAYDGGKYAEDTAYGRPPDPPLTPEQQAWADGVLREKGLLR
jgi:hypothetical protein